METKIVSIDLDSRAYDIYIGRALLYRFQDFVPNDLKGRSVFVVADKNLEKRAYGVRDQILQAGARSCIINALPAGEKTKSFGFVERVCAWMLQNGVNRNSLVIAMGGGVVGDLTGFCAAIVMRGVPFIQIPTTLLAQVDSSVGGKTGINTPEGKNLVGSFYQPVAVVADLETLETLPRRELLAGYAEIVKYGLIQDAGFFKWLEMNGERVCALEAEPLAHAIEVSCKAKAEIVRSDERESGQRALLNFGHTFGHALEAAAGYSGILLHGEAVAIGMVMAMDLSHRLGLCSLDEVEQVERHLTRIGLRTRASTVDGLSTNVNKLIEIMRRDKKVVSGNMVFIVLNAIGDAFIKDDVPEDIVREVIVESLGGESKGIKDSFDTAFNKLG